jgi:Kef-type K+ transport system membrane component KefB
MPRGRICEDAITRIEPLTMALLLPLFFTFSGLNTRIGLLDSWKDWGFCLLIVLTAILGKCVACWGAARSTGLSHHESLSIGVLMNTRGMMELIVINVGREKGLISDELFAMLVVMALVTTLMTAPAFDRIVRKQPVVIGCSDLPANLPEG